MPFKIAARLVLQLGAELISSDGIAFYELIKNAFDAGSRRVEIDVCQRLAFETYRALRRDLDTAKKADEDTESAVPNANAFNSLRDTVVASIDMAAPHSDGVLRALEMADSWRHLEEILDGCNYILIVDQGQGMTSATLDDVYLTIGTRFRLEEREKRNGPSPREADEASRVRNDGPILGEKGLGRLSVMRLGDLVRVETSHVGEPRLNVLQIDWRLFSHSSAELIENISLTPELGPEKANPKAHGTAIRIFGLTADWTFDKLKNLATQEFGKLLDPFEPASHYEIVVRFNGKRILIPSMGELLFEHAHAVETASYRVVEGRPELSGRIHYRIRGREKLITKNVAELVSLTGLPLDTLVSLGPFDMVLYWYNRQLLRRELDGIGEKTQVLELENDWSGGLKLYRDGFRVNPYGNKDDDWLDLDRKAFASGGYKVNRTQLVGKVNITSEFNPALVDQTNREGLRDCPEKRALIALLKTLLEAEFRPFLNRVDDELRAKDPITFSDFGNRVLSEEKQILRGLAGLVERHPEIKKETQIVQIIEESARKIRDLMREAQALADSVEEGHSKLLHLAGLGLMVEILAHELTRTTQNTIQTITAAGKSTSDRKLGSLFRTLESQLKTLEKRLRVLDPLSVSGRQRKEEFELIAWVEDVLASHAMQFQRHGIAYELRVLPTRPVSGMFVKAVKGMIVQILENLLSNSVYWLKVERRLNRRFSPAILVEIDTRAKEIRVSDNGPGVAVSRAEEIFQPFVTSKPPGEGKGLGLYISREIANYNGATLTLSSVPSVHLDHLNTFVLQLGGSSK